MQVEPSLLQELTEASQAVLPAHPSTVGSQRVLTYSYGDYLLLFLDDGQAKFHSITFSALGESYLIDAAGMLTQKAYDDQGNPVRLAYYDVFQQELLKSYLAWLAQSFRPWCHLAEADEEA